MIRTINRPYEKCQPAYTRGKGNRKIEKLQDTLNLISANLRPFCDKLVQSCAALVNLQTPISSGVFDRYTFDVSQMT